MKKILVFVLALAMLMPAALAEQAAEVTGIWYLNELVMGDTSMSAAELGVEMTLELKEDGSVVSSMMGKASEGTWSAEGDAITVNLDDVPAIFTLKDGNLTGEEDGQVMVFGREKIGEAFLPAEVKADAALEDYVGSWTAAKIGIEGIYLDPMMLAGEDITAVIEGSKVSLNGFMFFETQMETDFADGVLTYTFGEDAALAGTTCTFAMLEDGMLSLNMVQEEQSDMALYFVRAE